jgi:uncharacterized damage-inducible protein DinB
MNKQNLMLSIPEKIQQFETGGSKLRDAMADLKPEHLDAKPGPGAWSPRELVIHMADMDAIAIDRMKRIIAEDCPLLIWADDSAYNENLAPEVQDVEDALIYFEVGRRQFARVLRTLDDAEFQRYGIHSKRGKTTLMEFLDIYIWHLDHHLQFLLDKKKNLGY